MGAELLPKTGNKRPKCTPWVLHRPNRTAAIAQEQWLFPFTCQLSRGVQARVYSTLTSQRYDGVLVKFENTGDKEKHRWRKCCVWCTVASLTVYLQCMSKSWASVLQNSDVNCTDQTQKIVPSYYVNTPFMLPQRKDSKNLCHKSMATYS